MKNLNDFMPGSLLQSQKGQNTKGQSTWELTLVLGIISPMIFWTGGVIWNNLLLVQRALWTYFHWRLGISGLTPP